MITYDLEQRGSMPLYEYIYKKIKEDIIKGNFSANEKLPSKRSLANNLSVSLITIENAYEQLIYEGYIYSLEKRGYYVAEINTANQNYTQLQNINYSADNTQINNINPISLIDFQSNFSDSNIFPFSTWAKISRKVLLDNEYYLSNKAENQGALKLRVSISNYLKAYKGMHISPDKIIVGAGMEYLYSLILQILGRSKMIAVEDPGHTKVSKIYESNGVKVLHIPLDEYGFNPDKIANANVSCIHISPSHHYPTGIVMPASRRHQLIEHAINQNYYIIEDDYDSELRYDGRPLSSLASLAPDKVIYMNTFTKTLMSSVRIAYMVLPDELLRTYTDKLNFLSCTVSLIEQLTLSEFIDKGYFERHINRTRLFYKKCRKNFINSFYKSKLSNKFSLIEKDAGLHFIIKAIKNVDDKKYIDKLLENGIKINSLSSFCSRPEKEYSNSFLINYFSIEESQLIKIFNLMADLI